MGRKNYLVRSEVIAGFDDLVIQLGYDPAPMYRQVGLTQKLMSNPDHMVPCANVAALLDHAAIKLKMPHFGLMLARTRKVFQIGLLWPLISHSPSIKQALLAATQHLHLHNRGVLWHLDVRDDGAFLSRADRISSDVPTFQWAVYSTASMYAGLRALCGKQWHPSSVLFIHPTPKEPVIYDQFFGVSVKFNQEFNMIRFPASDLSENLAERSRFLYDQLSRQIQALEEKYQLEEEFSSKISLLIEQRMHSLDCTQPDIARLLSIHPKSLQRELKRRGTTFRNLKAELRLDMAERYLRDSDIPLTTVADILGFSELSSFSHAFHGRHGMSPADWRHKKKFDASFR